MDGLYPAIEMAGISPDLILNQFYKFYVLFWVSEVGEITSVIVLTDGVDLSINADNDTEGAKGLSQPSLANEFGTII